MKMSTVLKRLSAAALLAVMAGCTTAAVNPAVGTWDVSINTPIGKQPSVWTFNPDGTGSMTSAQGEQALQNLQIKGSALQFNLQSPGRNGSTSNLTFAGTVEGSSLSGELKPEGGPMSLAVKGTKRQ